MLRINLEILSKLNSYTKEEGDDKMSEYNYINDYEREETQKYEGI